MKHKKFKIEVGQCYRWDDHVYRVASGPLTYRGYEEWILINVLVTPKEIWASTSFLLKQERPFNNWG